MVPSNRLYGILLLGLAFCFGAAINLQVSLVAMLTFDFVLLSLAFWDGRRVQPNQVEVTRQPLGKLSVGRDNLVILKVHSAFESSQQSSARFEQAQIQLRDQYPPQFGVSSETFQTTLTPNTKELIYTAHPHQRGEFEWGDIQVRQLSPWKLAWRDWKISAREKVRIYPDLVGLRALSIRLALENTGTMRQARRLKMGTEFAELREYRQGDDTRAIDWKATARSSRPVVRVLEPEQKQTLIILLDRGRQMTAQVEGMKRFDWALNTALSLALAGLSRGDRVGIGIFDREITTWISPQRGLSYLPQIVERLTPIQPVLLEPDYLKAVTRVVKQQSRRALVVLITDIVDVTASADLLAALGRLTPRYLPFCVALRDPQVDKIAHTPSQDLDAAYVRAVALDLLSQRQVAFAQLKQQGVLVLDAPANQVSDQLVNRYVQLKARNLL